MDQSGLQVTPICGHPGKKSHGLQTDIQCSLRALPGVDSNEGWIELCSCSMHLSAPFSALCPCSQQPCRQTNVSEKCHAMHTIGTSIARDGAESCIPSLSCGKGRAEELRNCGPLARSTIGHLSILAKQRHGAIPTPTGSLQADGHAAVLPGQVRARYRNLRDNIGQRRSCTGRERPSSSSVAWQ